MLTIVTTANTKRAIATLKAIANITPPVTNSPLVGRGEPDGGVAAMVPTQSVAVW